MAGQRDPGESEDLVAARAALRLALEHEQSAERLARRVQHLETMLADGLREVSRLRVALRIEEAELQRWEGKGFGQLLLWLAGLLDDRREDERHDVEEASLHLADESDRAERVRLQLVEARDELRAAQEQATVAAARERVRSLLRSLAPIEGARLTGLEDQHAMVAADLRETDEALVASEAAQRAAEPALEQLAKARSWGTWDMLGGGVFISAMKHRRVDESLEHVQRLNAALVRLRTEASQVRFDLQIPGGLEVGSTARLLDTWFDNIFSDWRMQDRIETMQLRVRDVMQHVVAVHAQLQAHRDGLITRLAAQRAELDALYRANG